MLPIKLSKRENCHDTHKHTHAHTHTHTHKASHTRRETLTDQCSCYFRCPMPNFWMCGCSCPFVLSSWHCCKFLLWPSSESNRERLSSTPSLAWHQRPKETLLTHQIRVVSKREEMFMKQKTTTVYLRLKTMNKKQSKQNLSQK